MLWLGFGLGLGFGFGPGQVPHELARVKKRRFRTRNRAIDVFFLEAISQIIRLTGSSKYGVVEEIKMVFEMKGFLLRSELL